MNNRLNIWYFKDSHLLPMPCPTRTKGNRTKGTEEHRSNLYHKEEYIYLPGDPSENVYVVSSGRVKIGIFTKDGNEMIKSILSIGEMFGESALTGEGKRQEYAMALDDDTCVCDMTVDELQNLMQNDWVLSLKIFKIIGSRLRTMERKMESLFFKDARERIIDFLRETAEEYGQKVGYEVMIRSPLTHRDIASLIGTSRQTVNTVMNELREDNIIHFDRKRILIRDMKKLC